MALAALLAFAVVAMLTAAIARSATGPRRAAVSDQALASAREALVAYATSRPVDDVVGPGYLPCPDLDDDGWAEPTCGSLSGESGQWQRLGRLPWKTLGLPDLRDAFGERLWYAVSSKHKGLLNCAGSPACLDMGPEAALGTITVRTPAGSVVHDGTSSSTLDPGTGGAAAVIIAPGPAISRWSSDGGSGRPQVRTCEGGGCNAAGHCLTSPPTLTPKCNPENYLDRAPGTVSEEDNARFVDRNDAGGRANNGDGFIQGPVLDRDGRLWVNDRLTAISYDDLMPRVMRRVAEEVSSCLRLYAARPENNGRTPWAAPLCRSHDANPALRWADATGTLFGHLPDTPFLATASDSGAAMLTHWMPGDEGCRIADAGGNTASLARFTWWSAWRRHVFYTVSFARRPGSGAPPACDTITCLVVSGLPESHGTATGHRFAVLVAGHPLRFDGGSQSRDPFADLDARQWLESENADLRRLNANPAALECPEDLSYPAGAGSLGFNRISGRRTRSLNDVIVAAP